MFPKSLITPEYASSHWAARQAPLLIPRHLRLQPPTPLASKQPKKPGLEETRLWRSPRFKLILNWVVLRKPGRTQIVAQAGKSHTANTDSQSYADSAKHKLASQPFFRNDDWAFYVGIGTVGLLGLIEWPVVSVMAAGHALSRRIHNQALAEALEGIESAE
jgi:hypothetical protein